MGHIQPKTPVHCDNATEVGIANSTAKWQSSCLIEMRLLLDQWLVCTKNVRTTLASRPGNLADDHSTHHSGAHHTKVCPWYLHEPNSPLELPWALMPSALKPRVYWNPRWRVPFGRYPYLGLHDSRALRLWPACLCRNLPLPVTYMYHWFPREGILLDHIKSHQKHDVSSCT
jgi:hypothetical protein